jgi:hypothetical protein
MFGIREKNYSGFRIQKSKKHRIPDPMIKNAPDSGSLIRDTEKKRSNLKKILLKLFYDKIVDKLHLSLNQ